MNDAFDSVEDADWRDAYRSVLDACLPECFSVGDTAATVPRVNALAGLADEPFGDERPEDLLSALDAAGAVDCTDESVAVLFDPEENRPLTDERWTVAADALVGEIERIESEILPDGNDDREAEIEAKLEAIAEEIRNFTSGDDVPDLGELDDDQYERFRELKEEFVYYKNLQETHVNRASALAPILSDRTDRLRELPETSTDSLAEFGTAVEATAALRAAIDADDEAVRDRFERLASVLDG